jgi:hypothetical protein
MIDDEMMKHPSMWEITNTRLLHAHMCAVNQIIHINIYIADVFKLKQPFHALTTISPP